MKISISVPNDLFEAADALAERMDVSRSLLYATAVAEYIAKHRHAETTAKLNEVYAAEANGLDPATRSAQRRSVSGDEW